jgi:hypothetical protein
VAPGPGRGLSRGVAAESFRACKQGRNDHCADAGSGAAVGFVPGCVEIRIFGIHA